jgi:hypothetical protein
MQVWHHIAFHSRDQMDEALRSRGIRFKAAGSLFGEYILVFDISEDDPHWPWMREKLFEKYGRGEGFVYTTFTNEELLSCEWVRLKPGYERYYPQPESDMRYSAATFRYKCPSCGIEFDQVAPYRIRREASLGRHDFVSLYWTYGIFCTQRVVDAIQEAGLEGIEVWPVMLHGQDRPSEVLSQLLFPHVAGPGLAEQDKQQPEPCVECGVTKYAFHKRGYMHVAREALREGTDAQRTHEWFGSDTKWGYQEILISNRFARLIIDQGWKGVVLQGVELV